ncbi:unnamed protein product [Brassica napus]|uniref:(rape) hypothetical protein n=1 Tax=Brassica napus TaxID=3708 RepID=A0A816LRW7_BRANA|nr:unnamed protein product [Brassica napus]
MRHRADSYNPVPVFTYGENARQRNSKNNRNDVEIKNTNEEESMVKDIVCVSLAPEKIVSEEKLREDVAGIQNDKPRQVKITADTKAKRKSYRRSESDSSKWMVVSQKWENVEEESEEFSKMSNEELNRRVEDHPKVQ